MRYTLTITHVIDQRTCAIDLQGSPRQWDFEVRSEALTAYNIALVAAGIAPTFDDSTLARRIASKSMQTGDCRMTIEIRDNRYSI